MSRYVICEKHIHVRLQARAPAPAVWCSRPDQSVVAEAARRAALAQREFAARSVALRTAIVRQQLFFPDRRLIQYDCGKLQARAATLMYSKEMHHTHAHACFGCVMDICFISATRDCFVCRMRAEGCWCTHALARFARIMRICVTSAT